MMPYKGHFNTLQSSTDIGFYLRLQDDDGHGAVTWYRWTIEGWENVAPFRSQHLEAQFQKENKKCHAKKL